MGTMRAGALRAPLRAVALAATLLATGGVGHAMGVTHQYTSLGGTAWAVDFALTNDGSLPAFAGFSVYFTPGVFTNLGLAASPTGWDSIVLQPDLGLPAPGLFDTFAMDATDLPAIGGSQGGFRVSFDWLGTGFDPGRLQYTINDADFNVLAQGLTVPEPSSAILAALGLAAVGVARRKRLTETSQPKLTEARQ